MVFGENDRIQDSDDKTTSIGTKQLVQDIAKFRPEALWNLIVHFDI